MQRNKIFSRLLSLMLMAAAITTFTACSSDDDNDSKAKQYDDLEYFQKALCNIDANGNLVGYKHGLAIALNDDGKMKWSDAKSTCEGKNTSTRVANAAWLLPSKEQWNAMLNANGGYTGLNAALAAAGGDSSKLLEDVYWSSTEYDSDMARFYNFYSGKWDFFYKSYDYYARACLVF